MPGSNLTPNSSRSRRCGCSSQSSTPQDIASGAAITALAQYGRAAQPRRIPGDDSSSPDAHSTLGRRRTALSRLCAGDPGSADTWEALRQTPARELGDEGAVGRGTGYRVIAYSGDSVHSFRPIPSTRSGPFRSRGVGGRKAADGGGHSSSWLTSSGSCGSGVVMMRDPRHALIAAS